MIKIKAHCGIGYVGATYEEELEFEDDVTEYEIEEEVDEWAQQFLETWWERKKE